MSHFENFDGYKFMPVLGFSGSNKSLLMNDLFRSGHQVIDFEKIIGIDGACLAPLTRDKHLESPLDSQVFNLLSSFDKARPIFVEWKSSDVLGYSLPLSFTSAIRNSLAVVLNESFQNRVNNICTRYSCWADHLDLVLDKLVNISRKGFLLPLALHQQLKECKDVEFFVEIVLRWLDSVYQNEIDLFRNKLFGKCKIVGGEVVIIGSLTTPRISLRKEFRMSSATHKHH